MKNKYKKHLQKVMDAATMVEVSVVLISGLAACEDLIYLIPFAAGIAAVFYTRLTMRRWGLE